VGYIQRECYLNSIRTIDMGEFIAEHQAKLGILFTGQEHASLQLRVRWIFINVDHPLNGIGIRAGQSP
jgi:hypothetical protein